MRNEVERDSLSFPTPLRQGFGGQAPGRRHAAPMTVPPSSRPSVDPISL